MSVPASISSPGSPRVVAFGEILWDLFPTGARRFGGAPANFACHCATLLSTARPDARVGIVSGVGDDPLGQRALEILRARSVDTSAIEVLPDHPTGRVTVTLDVQGKATFAFAQDEAWDHLSVHESAATCVSRADALCFGSLGQRHVQARRAIQHWLDVAPAGALRIFDVNLRPPHVDRQVIADSLQRASVLKLNDDELPVLARHFGMTGTVEARLEGLRREFELATIALTLGDQGSLVLDADGIGREPGRSVQVRDTVGAGDSFTAAMTVGLLTGMDRDAWHAWAADVAAFVCTQEGATPDLPPSLLRGPGA